MAISLQPYSNYIQQISALIGVPTGRVSTELAESLRVMWNNGMERVWQNTTWLDICPYGEARFVGNKLTYPNDLSKTANWTATALTITGDNFVNPLDGRTTASKLIETVANSAHSAAQGSVAIVQNTGYTLQCYARVNGRSWAYLKFNDGVNNYTAFFDVSTGVVGTVAGTGATATIGQMPSGYWLCSLSFTTATTASATGTATLQISTDGSTLSYAGDTSKGLYVWGVTLHQTTNTGVGDSLIAYDQTGEERIETVFQVWQDNPFNTSYPREAPYILQKDGIQIISGSVVQWPVVNSAGISITTPQANPVFIWYRKEMPSYSGSDYSASSTYAVDDQILFTASDSTYDYYRCIVATSAGQSPSTTAASWSKRQIPASLFWPAMMYAYSDWLISDGQNEKAVIAETRATARMEDNAERESNQMGRNQLPFRVNTHVSSSWRTY